MGRPQGGQGGKGSRKKTTIILAAVAAVVLATIIGLTTLFIINAKSNEQEEERRAELNKLKQEVKDWEDSLKRCDKKIIKYNNDKGTLNSQIKQLEQGIKLKTKVGKPITIEDTKSKLEQTETNITNTETNKKEVQKTINKLNKKIDRIEKELNKKNGNQDTKKADKGKNYTKKTPKAENPPSPVIASGTPTTGDASLSEEKLDNDFDELCNQMNKTVNKQWRDKVFKAWLNPQTKQEISSLKNIYKGCKKEKKKQIVDDIKNKKPKK